MTKRPEVPPRPAKREWVFDVYLNGKIMPLEELNVIAPNYDAAVDLARALVDPPRKVTWKEAQAALTAAVAEPIRVTGLEGEQESASWAQAQKEAAGLYDHIAGDPEVYEALYKMMQQEADALPQRQAMDVAFEDLSISMDAIVDLLRQLDVKVAEAATDAKELRRAASRPPEPDMEAGDFEAATFHLEAVAIMQARVARLFRFAHFWSAVPVMSEGWEEYRAEAANHLNVM